MHLVAIATDDVAPPGQSHGLGLVFDVLLALGQNERNEGGGIVEHEVAHELVGALANAENVQEPARLEFGDRLGADHAAVGDDAHPADRKALAQPIDHGDQAAGVGGVPGPHLGAHRPAVAVEQHRQDHLVEIGPMVLGKAATPQGLAAGPLEVEAGRVHEHQIERAEEIAPPRKQGLLHDVLQAARRKRRSPVLLIFSQFLAEPGHRAVEMMQVEAVDALDPVIFPPTVRRPIRAAGEQRCRTVRNTARSSAKSCLRAPARFSTTSRQPVSSHNRSNTRAGPMRRAALAVTSPAATASTTMALAAKRAPERSNRSNCPLSRKSSTRPSVAMTCWRTAAPSRRLSTIWR